MSAQFVGCPGILCILMLILLLQEGLPQGGEDNILMWFHENLLHSLTGQIKACDWAVEGKGGQEVSERREEGGRGGGNQHKAEPHGLEKPQVVRGLIAEK